MAKTTFGSIGHEGARGPQGPAGPTGSASTIPGPTGPQGETGPAGPQGETGSRGPAGTNGSDGAKGDKGDTGSQGPKGDTGSQGPIGPAGDTNIHPAVNVIYTVNTSGTYHAGTLGADGGYGIGAYIESNSNGNIGSIDGHALVIGDRILYTGNTDARTNGIYQVTALGSSSGEGGGSKWRVTRTSDADNSTALEVAPGDYVFVNQGTVHAGQAWMLNASGTGTNGSIKIGTDNISWTQVGAAGTTGATGATGPAGADGADGLGFTYKGNYSSSTTYSINDVVFDTSTGNSYVSKTNSNRSHTPSSNTSYWGEIAASGANGATGATGATGPAGDGITPRGNWSSNTSYAVNDLVYHAASNASYVATVAGSNHIPSNSSSYWTVSAQDGNDGATGATGATGPQGATGAAGSDSIHSFRSTIPSLPTSSGIKGEWAVDASYLYVCYATNSWRRIALTTWSTQNQGGSN